VSGLNPEFELLNVIQFVAAFYTTEQIHFRFQKEQNRLFFLLKDAEENF
jgi:hypothetical protein